MSNSTLLGSFGQKILELKAIEHHIFIGSPFDLGWGRLYGGHLMAQSIQALKLMGYNPHRLHAFHCTFLRVGSSKSDIQYKVTPLQKGSQYSSFQVNALQRSRLIFQTVVSYGPNSDVLHHQPTCPKVPPPQHFPNDHDILRDLQQKFPHSKGLQRFTQRRLSRDSGLDIHPITPRNFLYTEEKDNLRQLWFRMRSRYNQELQNILLPYVSDFLLIGLSLQPHTQSVLNRGLKYASLNQAMWFYGHYQPMSWLLFHAKSIVYRGNRALMQAQIFDSSGVLLASIQQEALIYQRATA